MKKFLLLIAAVILVLATGCGGDSPSPVPPPPDQVPAPTAIAIPKINTGSSLIRLGVNEDMTVQVPDVNTPMQAGWFAFSAKPGAPGPAVILGHVDGNDKPGVFYRLHELQPGNKVFVMRDDGTELVYEITRVWHTDKDEFPTEEVYGNTEDSQLRLITCGGEWEGGDVGYANNVIADAVLVN